MGNECEKKESGEKCTECSKREIKVTRRGMLPIFYCKEWDAWCLLDTGSNSSVIGNNVVGKICPEAKVVECNCEVVTLTGVKPLLGETDLPLKGLVGQKKGIRVHVAEIPNREYDVILGCDILELVKGYPKIVRGGWKIKLGKKTYRSERTTGFKKYIVVSNVNIRKGQGDESSESKLLKEYSDIIYQEGDKLTATGRVRHGIVLDNDRPVYIKPRRYPQAMKEVIKSQITELLKQGIIRKSSSVFNSPVWIVPKAPGSDGKPKYRLVIDFRELNRRTREEKYPLPRVEDILDRMHGARVFSVLDLKSGYHQIQMRDEDIAKTAFSFERGHFEFLRMPFGLRNAPSTFQRLMDEVLEGLDENFCQIYMDDIIIFSRDERAHDKDLRRLFERLRRYGLKIAKEKSHFYKSEVKFMGHVISEKGVRPNPEKTDAIKRMTIPKNPKEVRGFLGVINYYRRFVKNLSEITKPLTKLLQKGSRFILTEQILEAINKCKEVLCSEQILRFPDFTRQFIVTTDASQYALGAVLSQGDKGAERPIEFASKQLNAAESRYSAIERELLGVVWAVEHFRPYVFGRKFLIKTDHKPLVWTEKLKENSSRITRWKERLAAYDFEIEHTSGIDNAVADWLSRAVQVNAGEIRDPGEYAENGPNLGQGPGTSRAVQEGETGLRTTKENRVKRDDGIVNDKRNQIIWEFKTNGETEINNTKYGHLSITNICTRRDVSEAEILQILNEVIVSGKAYFVYTGNRTLKKKIKDMYERGNLGDRTDLTICERRVETVTDLEQQTDIIKDYHTGKTNHRGINETLMRLKRSYYWINMEKTINTVIRGCNTCNIVKYDRRPHQTLQLVTETAKRPFEIIHGDLFRYEGNIFLTMIDSFSKYAFVQKLEDKTAEQTLDAVLNFMGLFGTPDKIILDNGREFNNGKFKRQMIDLEINVHFTTVGHPRSQGVVERLHSTLTEHLQLIKLEQDGDIKQAMRKATIAYNNTIHRTTGYTPIEIVFGDNRGNRATKITEANEEVGKFYNDRRKEAKSMNTRIRDRLDQEKHKRVDRINMEKGENIGELLKIGDTVYRKNFYKRRKGDNRYLGPYTIVKVIDRNRVMLADTTHPNRKRVTTHINEIKIPCREGRKRICEQQEENN